MTEIDAAEGKLYLAVALDLFSRRLLRYAMGARHEAALVGASLKMAAAIRGGAVIGVVFHSVTTRDQDRIEIATWISSFYSTCHRHTSPAGHPPAEFEPVISKAHTDHIQQD